MHTELSKKEYIEITKSELVDFLFNEWVSEINDAEEYFEQAECAKNIGEAALANTLITIAKDELKHSDLILAQIKSIFPNIEDEPLYPLMKHTKHREMEIKEDIESFK